MKGRVASRSLPWINFSVLPVTLQMRCLLLSMTDRSHHLPMKHRNRGNDSRCCLCICLTALPEHLWEGGGGRGLHWVNPTAVREPLLLSPLSNHMVAVSWMCVSGMCIWAHAFWNLAFEISRIWFLYLKPSYLTLPGPLCLALLPMALGTSLRCCRMPPSPSLPVLEVRCIQWFCREGSWNDACAPVGFMRMCVLDFCRTLSKTRRISDARCFFFLI